MSRKKKELVDEFETATRLGVNTRFDGDLAFDSSLVIKGSYKGNIASTGYLYVEQGAVIDGDIRVRSVVIAGVINGNIEATEMLEMKQSGKVFGNVRTARLKIAEGVLFEGRCDMMKDPENVDVFSASVSQLKQSVENV